MFRARYLAGLLGLVFALGGCHGEDTPAADDDMTDEHGDDDTTVQQDADGDGYTVKDGDCDDALDSVYPGAPELCDDIDNDCDGSLGSDEIDNDADGASECQGDCDDTDALLNLLDVDEDGGSTCDGDCDDEEGLLNTLDLDSDGYTTCAGDCDDVNPGVYPGNGC